MQLFVSEDYASLCKNADLKMELKHSAFSLLVKYSRFSYIKDVKLSPVLSLPHLLVHRQNSLLWNVMRIMKPENYRVLALNNFSKKKDV